MHDTKLKALLLVGFLLLGGVYAYAALDKELGKISYHIVITPTTVTATEFSLDLGYIYPPTGEREFADQFTLSVGGDNPAHLMFALKNTSELVNDFSDFQLTLTLTSINGDMVQPVSITLYSPHSESRPSCVEIDLGQGDYQGDVTVSYTINSSLSGDVVRTNMPIVQVIQDGTCSP